MDVLYIYIYIYMYTVYVYIHTHVMQENSRPQKARHGGAAEGSARGTLELRGRDATQTGKRLLRGSWRQGGQMVEALGPRV